VRREHAAYGVLALAAAMVAIGCGGWGIVEFYKNTLLATRNFYGVLRVQQYGDSEATRRLSLVHGTILHGTQYLAPDLRHEPSTYYTRTSGIGRAIESLHPTVTPIRVGVVGLGAGTIATYGSTGDVYRFYEINPAVIEIAQRDFSFLSGSEATIELALGDARLSLEREPPQQFDVLAVDAFSSDSIPVHLITYEALGIYLRHMKPDGIVAFHVTNRYLDLVPVVDALARAHGLAVTHVRDDTDEGLANISDWVLIARSAARLEREPIAEASEAIVPRPDWRLWTDDFNNLVQVLKR
jgi:SAM-dependent methyltransferase